MNTSLLISLIGEALVGISLVLAPAAILSLFGVAFNDIAISFARLFGSAVISFPILLWFAYRSDKPEFRYGVIYSLFAYYLVSTLIFVNMLIAGQMNALGWILPVLHGAFAILFGYFILKKLTST
jgi:hypothetical protein